MTEFMFSDLLTVKNIKKNVREAVNSLGLNSIFQSLTITQFVYAKDTVSKHAENYRVLFPSERIEFTDRRDQEFLKICDQSVDFKDGVFERSEIFVCNIAPAYINIGGGIVCTQDFEFVVEPGLEYRLDAYSRIGWSRPILSNRIERISSLCSSLFTIGWSKNYWHWLYEDLPKIYSLILAVPSEHLTLLIPDDLSGFQKEFLKHLLPDNFELRYVSHGSWLKADRFLMPSFASRRRNGLLPSPYYEYIRNTIFKKINLPSKVEPSEYIYISRAKANHRRILNEDKLVRCLSKYGFRTVFLEEMSFEEQIDLFRKAKLVVGAHGAGLATTLFSGKIKVFALYPNREPLTFFFTQCKGLGQDHYFIAHDMPGLDDDFEVDIQHFERLLAEEINLSE